MAEYIEEPDDALENLYFKFIRTFYKVDNLTDDDITTLAEAKDFSNISRFANCFNGWERADMIAEKETCYVKIVAYEPEGILNLSQKDWSGQREGEDEDGLINIIYNNHSFNYRLHNQTRRRHDLYFCFRVKSLLSL